MKKYSLMILALLFCASSAFGYSYSWTGTYDPADILIGGIWDKEIALNGFNQSTDTVTSAKFVFYLYDDNNYDNQEKAVVRFSSWNLDQQSWTIDALTSTAYEAQAPWTVSLGALDDGVTTFDLYADYGDFKFDKVVLCASGNREGANPVPEPATMLMIGLGLVGLAGFGRKKFNS
jgi:hypothetical protein